MVFPTLLAATALAHTQFAERFEIPVKNVCASYLVSQNHSRDAQGGIEDHWKRLAPAFDLSADDSKNVIVALGPAKSLDDLKRLVAMFDVAPMRLRLKVRIEVPRFGFDSTSTVTQGNNQQHLFSEPAVGFEASILPRFNDDGTVTLFVGTDHRGRHDRATRKLKVGDSVRVSAPGSATGSSGAEGIKETVGEALSEGAQLGASVTITVEELIERPPASNTN